MVHRIGQRLAVSVRHQQCKAFGEPPFEPGLQRIIVGDAEILENLDIAPKPKRIELAQPGDLVVCLGAGSISAWAYALPGEIAKLAGAPAKAGGAG